MLILKIDKNHLQSLVPQVFDRLTQGSTTAGPVEIEGTVVAGQTCL